LWRVFNLEIVRTNIVNQPFANERIVFSRDTRRAKAMPLLKMFAP